MDISRLGRVDKPHAYALDKDYKARINDVVAIEGRITAISNDHFKVEPLNGAEVYLSDVSRFTELRAPLSSPVVKRPLRPGDKVRYNVEEGVNEGYYRGRLIAFDNGKWIIRDNTSQRTGGSLVERKEEDIYFD